ncbi:MAG TPA: DUF4340 domain-containing protein [bacterium]|nr:DUF4340 domain-containing protein [bacterium]
MNRNVILVLVAFATALGLVLYLTDEKLPIERTAHEPVLDGRSLTAASRIRWQFKDRQAIEIGHAEDGRFQMQEPIVDIASAGYLEQIVQQWDNANMMAVPFADDEEGRAKAGLEEPALEVIVEWPDGHRIEYQFGDVGPLGETRFVRRAGKIWEVRDTLFDCLHVGRSDLRERQVFRHGLANVRTLRVEQVGATGAREALRLERAGRDQFQLTEPVKGRADEVAAKRFITAVLSLRVDHFQPGLVREPDRAPDIVISAEGGYGEERLDLWVEQGQVWGRLPGRGHLFTSDNRQYCQVFQNAVNQLRARILVPMGDSTYEQLVELVVDPGQGRGDRIRLVRKSQHEAWRMLEPIEYRVRATPVNEAAHALSLLVAKEFVDEDGVHPRAEDPRYGMAGARWTVTTRRVNMPGTNTLWFGAQVPGTDEEPLVYVARADEPDNVAVVPQHPLEVLQRPWTVYCDLQVLRQTGTIERLVLEDARGQKRVFAMDREGLWRLDGSDRDRSEVGDLASEVLCDFAGKAAVDMRSGFAPEPDWRLLLQRRNGDQLGEIRVWDRGADQPLVVRGNGEQPVGLELNARNSRDLRSLWQ